MTKLIPLDSAIDTLTELSCDDNAHWGAIIDAIRAIPAIDPAAIREAALREAADMFDADSNIAQTILALIGKANSMIGEKK